MPPAFMQYNLIYILLEDLSLFKTMVHSPGQSSTNVLAEEVQNHFRRFEDFPNADKESRIQGLLPYFSLCRKRFFSFIKLRLSTMTSFACTSYRQNKLVFESFNFTLQTGLAFPRIPTYFSDRLESKSWTLRGKSLLPTMRQYWGEF